MGVVRGLVGGHDLPAGRNRSGTAGCAPVNPHATIRFQKMRGILPNPQPEAAEPAGLARFRNVCKLTGAGKSFLATLARSDAHAPFGAGNLMAAAVDWISSRDALRISHAAAVD